MIGRLRGKVIGDDPTGVLVVDVQGVGYEVMTPVGTRGRAQSDESGAIVLITHLHKREDALELFGFASDEERRVFRLLIDTPNVGPKTALGVMSALPVPELASAVAAGDVARLTRVPGIGKKTAERLVLELKERLAGVVAPAAGAAPARGDAARLVSALTNMGYKTTEAERAVKALGDQLGRASLAESLKKALAHLTP